MKKKFQGAVFDMDGTLLDSMWIWKNLSVEFLRFHGIVPPDGLYEKLEVMGIRTALKFLTGEFDIPVSQEQAQLDMHQVLKNYYREKAELKPGVSAMLQQLRSRGVRTVVLSATPADALDTALETHGLKEFFSHGLLSCETLKRNKTQPEIFYETAAFLDLPPDDVIVFEDALYAVKTVKAAGMTLGGVYDRFEKFPGQVRELSDIYIGNSWDELVVGELF